MVRGPRNWPGAIEYLQPEAKQWKIVYGFLLPRVRRAMDPIEDGTLDSVDQRITSDLQVVLDGESLWIPHFPGPSSIFFSLYQRRTSSQVLALFVLRLEAPSRLLLRPVRELCGLPCRGAPVVCGRHGVLAP